jgi:hypothetical protein
MVTSLLTAIAQALVSGCSCALSVDIRLHDLDILQLVTFEVACYIRVTPRRHLITGCLGLADAQLSHDSTPPIITEAEVKGFSQRTG